VRPLVEVKSLDHSDEDLKFFHNYFHWNFLWSYAPGTDFSQKHHNHFVSDYTMTHSYVKEDPIVKRIWFKLCDKFNIDPSSKVGRCYLVGQPINTDGVIHDDTNNDVDDVRTIVYYVSFNPHRMSGHRGTKFYFDDGTEEEIPYVQDTAVCFDAKLAHQGLSTNTSNSLRISLVFHCVNLDKKLSAVFEDTCGVDERLDKQIRLVTPR
jgi:hypothetical protein